ncbi:MAG: hypothetical protein ABI759_27715 [Candidatus Solibacter sp.]
MKTGWLGVLLAAASGAAGGESALPNLKQAKSIVLSRRVTGQVGKSLDFRVVQTDRSVNYKLRATWMTPEVIRANARIQQLEKGLREGGIVRLEEEARAAGSIVILVELDPHEGSGVIPSDWVALLGAPGHEGDTQRLARGVSSPKLRDVAALGAVPPRDYSYELFWIVFPLTGNDGRPLFDSADQEAELTVRIQNRSGKVHWRVPDHVRAGAKAAK